MTGDDVVVWYNPQCSRSAARKSCSRTGEPRYRGLGLASATADELIEAMTRHPELIQHPVAIWPDRAVIARPPELLLPLLQAGRQPGG